MIIFVTKTPKEVQQDVLTGLHYKLQQELFVRSCLAKALFRLLDIIYFGYSTTFRILLPLKTNVNRLEYSVNTNMTVSICYARNQKLALPVHHSTFVGEIIDKIEEKLFNKVGDFRLLSQVSL